MRMRRRILPGVLVLTLGLLGLSLAAPVNAATKTWVGPSGSGWWNTGSNWSPASQPQNGDTVNLTQSDTTNRTIEYYNTLYPSAVLNSLKIDATGSGTMALRQERDPLSAIGETIGASGNGSFAQTGGSNTLSNYLYLGSTSTGSGTYDLSGTGSSLSAVHETIGYSGTGAFTQSGGSNTSSNNLELGYGSTGNGTYDLSGGSLTTADSETMGHSGTGAFTQTGGANTISSNLQLGDAAGSNGTYTLSGGTLDIGGNIVDGSGTGTLNIDGGALTVTGGSINVDYFNVGDALGSSGSHTLGSGQTLSVGYETIGNSGTGAFTQTGGSNTSSNNLELGYGSTGNGTYNLSGGSLTTADTETIGNSGNGAFTQSGGSNTINYIYLGYGSTGNGTYDLSGGSLTTTGETMGDFGTGTFTQTGGSNTIPGGILYLGFFGNGTYNLSGTGSSLSAGEEDIGNYGTGTFTQSGGSNTISYELYLGGGTSPSSGTYSISTGNLEVKDFYIGSSNGNGTLKITGPAANISVSHQLSFGPHSTFTAVPGATIQMTGSTFDNRSTDPTALAGLSNLELVFEGGSGPIDPFEVAGRDLSAVMAGFDNNFALGTLTLGGTDIGKVQMSDLSDNQPGWVGNEALYVYNLNIGAGSYLYLNGLNLYYLHGSIDPGATIDYSGGSLTAITTPIPEPGTLLLLGIGLVGLVRLRKKRT